MTEMDATLIAVSERRPPRTVGRVRALAEVLAVALAFVVASSLLGPLLGVPLAALCLYAGVLAGWALLKLSGSGWKDLGLCTPRNWASTVRAALAATVLSFVLVAGIFLLQRLGAPPLDLSLLRDVVSDDPWMYLVTMVLVVWGSAAFAEELIFRGFMLNRFEVAVRGLPGAMYWAVALQAMVFGLAHAYQGVLGILYSGTIGALFGLVYVTRNRNLWAPILAHGLVDSIAVTLLFLGWL